MPLRGPRRRQELLDRDPPGSRGYALLHDRFFWPAEADRSVLPSNVSGPTPFDRANLPLKRARSQLVRYLRAMQSAPKHLRAASRRWWNEVAGAFVLEAHQVELLNAAAGCLDRMAEARELIKADGLVVPGRYGVRANPAVAIERDARLAFARLVRELGLSDDAAESRPPLIPGRYAS